MLSSCWHCLTPKSVFAFRINYNSFGFKIMAFLFKQNWSNMNLITTVPSDINNKNWQRSRFNSWSNTRMFIFCKALIRIYEPLPRTKTLNYYHISWVTNHFLEHKTNKIAKSQISVTEKYWKGIVKFYIVKCLLPFL